MNLDMAALSIAMMSIAARRNMGWASSHIKKLQAGETVQFRPRGNSMTGKVDDGDLVTIKPLLNELDWLFVGEGSVVLCKVHGKEFLHLIKAVKHNKMFQIGNNKGNINGWAHKGNIYGVMVAREK